MACFAARDTSPAAAGEHDQPRLLFLIREDSAPADKAAMGVAPARVDVSWDAIVDDRTEAMLAVLRAARDEIGR